MSEKLTVEDINLIQAAMDCLSMEYMESASEPPEYDAVCEKLAAMRKAAQNTPQPTEQHDPHPDDAAIERFAAVMKAKLSKKREEGRHGWQSMTAEQLSALLHEHVRKGDPVDVANLAMMLHQNGQRIEHKPAPDVAGLVEALETTAEKLKLVMETAQYIQHTIDKALAPAREALAAYRKQGRGE